MTQISKLVPSMIFTVRMCSFIGNIGFAFFVMVLKMQSLAIVSRYRARNCASFYNSSAIWLFIGGTARFVFFFLIDFIAWFLRMNFRFPAYPWCAKLICLKYFIDFSPYSFNFGVP